MFKVVDTITVGPTAMDQTIYRVNSTDQMGTGVFDITRVSSPFRNRIKISDDFKKLYAEELERARYYREVTEL